MPASKSGKSAQSKSKVSAKAPEPVKQSWSDRLPSMPKLPQFSGEKSWWLWGGIAVAAVVVILGIFATLIYKFKSSSPVVAAVAKVVPFPAERVNGRFVSYSEYLFAFNQLEHFCSYSKANNLALQPWCGDVKQARQTALDELKERPIVKALVVKYKITVTKKELDDSVNQVIQSTGGDAKVRQALHDIYGWTLNDFRYQVQYQLERQKLATAVASDDNVNSAAKALAEQVLAKAKAGADFAKLAKQYSQDTASASSGGDLGFFGKGKMVPEFDAVVFSLKKGQIADQVVKTQFGYHIIKVTDKKGSQVRASHILIKAVDFEQYIQDQITQAKITDFVKP